MFRMLKGEKTSVFWVGLIILSLAASTLLGIFCLIAIEPPESLPSLWNFWITPPPIKLGLLAAPIVGCVVFILIGFYMMRQDNKENKLKAAVTSLSYSERNIAARLPLEIAEVEGMGPKNEKKLKALGINKIEDLAKASAKELAKKTKTPPEIVAKWIEEAARLTEWWEILCSYIYEKAKSGS